MQSSPLVLLAFQALSLAYGQLHYVKLRQRPNDDNSCLIIQSEPISYFRGFSTTNENEVKIYTREAVQGPGDAQLVHDDGSKLIEIFAKKKSFADAHIETLCISSVKVEPLIIPSGSTGPEVKKIVDGGDQENRIDVVFMGDGYQESEKDEFFEDIARLTKDMFEGPTFRSYLPVFNIWAIYVASVDSGIGYNDKPLNTAFKLYRQGGTLRGILTADDQYPYEVCQLTGKDGCDYPSLIANDDFYGGLGGQFVISTRSKQSGTMVLRHEMGHNFIDVGEEYDGGRVYRGVNNANSIDNLGWSHWLSSVAREERVIYRVLDYPWKDLSKGEHAVTFESDGLYSRWLLILSVSAAGEADSIEFDLDGQVLPWKSRGSEDREMYDWVGDKGFTKGSHTLKVRSKTSSTHPKIPRMICNINIHEFGSEDEFRMSNDHVSAYPTFDYKRNKTFRPTNHGCLMRNMTSSSFCPICREGMWLQFLQRISLIDSILVSPNANPDGTKDVTLNTLKLGSQRAPGNEVECESLNVQWAWCGEEKIELRDKFYIKAVRGPWTVIVQFVTPEIRLDPEGLTIDSMNFTV